MRAIYVASVAALAIAACQGRSDAGAQNQSAPAAASDAAARPFEVQQVGQFDTPWAIAFLPDGRALVTEKKGALKLWQADGKTTEVAGVPQVAFEGQGGLLDVALAPDFAGSRAIYLTYAEPRSGGSSLALARATLDETGAPSLKNLQVLFRGGSDGKGGQFGAIIAFSPDSRYLFLTSGERQRFTPAQDPNQTLGKILRLTLDGKPAPGNPQAGKTGAPTVPVADPPSDTEAAKTAVTRTYTFSGPNLAPAETWTSGHRNPYGLAFAPDGRLWEHEMGPKGGDEFNLIEPGKNYGWPEVSYGENYNGVPIAKPSSRPDFQEPALYWNPVISPAGLIFYSGKLWPQWKGSAFIGALSGKALVRVTVDGATARKAEQWDMGTRIRDVAEAPDGSIFLLEDGGRGASGHLLKLVPAGG